MTPATRQLISSIAVGVVVLVAGAFLVDATVDTGASNGATSGDSSGSGNDVVLKIADFAFHPPVLEVAAGATVEVENADGATHTVTSGPRDEPDGAFDVTVDGGGHGTFTIDEPGTYSYVCAIHPSMQPGTIKVSP